MNRLLGQPRVTYDSNLIIYYCFSTKDFKISQLTQKIHKLTEILVNNGSKIIIPKFIIKEINNVTFSEIVCRYITEDSRANNLTKRPTFLFRVELEGKIRKKFNKLLKKDWLLIEDCIQSKGLTDQITEFFLNLDDYKLKGFLAKKKKSNPLPSKIDIKLIGFSKESNSILISNDYDITYFASELFKKGLSGKIYNLKDICVNN